MTKEREFTSKHAILVFVGFFGTIFAVNMTMAYFAVSTFPGLEVRNGYVASQQFNSRRIAQEALGWTVNADAQDGQIILSITDAFGNPVKVASLMATLGRATQIRDDSTPDFKFDGTAYLAPAELAPGNWNIRIVAQAANGTDFTQRVILHVKK